MTDVTGLINTVTSVLPSVLALIRTAHSNANPEDPPLTDEQVFAALHDAVAETVAKDDQLAADIRARNP